MSSSPVPTPIVPARRRAHPPLGSHVRWNRRAGRYYFWEADAGGDPDSMRDARVSSKDGVPWTEQQRIIDQIDEDAVSGQCGIHEWDEPGEGVLVGLTSRTLFTRMLDDETQEFIGMQRGVTRQFYEVRQHLRGRRIIVPLDALDLVT